MKVVGDLGAGHTLGRYELLVPIAQGGMAVVWAARMKGTRGFQKIVAVKSMLPNLSEDPQFEEMFLAEAELASRIRHPHVCEILDLGEQDGTLYIVMEWVDGEPLSQIQKASRLKGGIPLAIAARIAFHAALGLHAAHELKDEEGALVHLVHRDVSPQNILVTYDGVVKIVDFGVAKATKGADGGRTKAGQVKGKVPFFSPEQALGKNVDRRTDVFALGIVLYQMIAGKHPFRGDNDMVTLHRICDTSPVPPVKSVVPDCPDALNDAIAKALEKDPAKRFQNMTEMARALEKGIAALARPEAKPEATSGRDAGPAGQTSGRDAGPAGQTSGAKPEIDKDEDLATFIRRVVGERADKRKAAIKEAIRTADTRAEQRRSGSGTFAAVTAGALGGQENTNPSGVSDISQVSVKSDANPPISGVTGLPLGPAGAPSARASQGQLSAGAFVVPDAASFNAPKKGKKAAVAMAVGVAAIGIAAAAMFLGKGAGLPASGAGPAPAVTAPAPVPSAEPQAATPPAASASAAEAIPFGALAPADTAKPRPAHGGGGAPRPVKSAAPAVTPPKGGTTVPQVRDPGF